MKFKVGDKVKFLNESGGGVVSKVISSKLVNIAIEDGFDIPTLCSDLVKIEPESKADEMFDEEFNVNIEKDNSEKEIETRTVSIGNFSEKGTNIPGVYLAFVPHDQQWLITGMLDIYLINHTGYDILFSLFLKSDKGTYSGIDYDVIGSASMLLLDTTDREDIEKWKEGIIQILFHKDKSSGILLPASSDFKIKSSKLNKETNYIDSSFIDKKAFIITISELSSMQLVSSNKTELKKDQPEIAEKKAEEVKIEILIDKHKTAPKEAVVDLHIGELIENISELESKDMLQIQKDYFVKCLESAIENNYHKVTFIHGVGNGILKNTIIKILKDYEDIGNRSASLAKFGVGAIDVLIRPVF